MIVSREMNLMNTIISIQVVRDFANTIEINSCIQSAFDEFQRIVNKFTRFNENSELSNLNRQSSQWVKVSEELFFLIQKLLSYAELSEGAFDPTIIDFLEVYGYDKNYDFSKLDNPKLDLFVKNIKEKRTSWRNIEIKEESREVKLAKNQKIDLGGIGKGYAIDKAFEQLEKVCSNFLIDAGGDIRVKGKNENGEKWNVALKSENEVVGGLELESGDALACSGSWARKVKQFHHLIDPTTGNPAKRDYSTVFVKANTATDADAWATAFFIGGKDIAKKYENQFLSLFV